MMILFKRVLRGFLLGPRLTSEKQVAAHITYNDLNPYTNLGVPSKGASGSREFGVHYWRLAAQLNLSVIQMQNKISTMI